MLGITTLHNSIILSTLSMSSRDFAFGFPKSSHTMEIDHSSPNNPQHNLIINITNATNEQKFDAVVGDVTIRANRSTYIDYTLPFTESGVAMVVPMKTEKNTNAWVFLKPLTWKLWALTAGFFLFIALVVWILEHRVNEEFRGSSLDQICTSLWYSFSTMVFAHSKQSLPLKIFSSFCSC